jgi:hypothetical protein
MDTETPTQMSRDFMDALRLGDLTQQQEPQLSVRLRGSRVELASASEEEQVDFLGPAENIKRLFKLPYSQSRVSLAVHRVGSTLVVDGELNENDLPAGFEDLPQDTLQLAQQSDETTQRLLYEKFIYESTVQSQLPASEEEAKEEEPGERTTHRKKKKHGKKKAKKKQKAASEQVELLPVAEPDKGDEQSPVPSASIDGLTSGWPTGPDSSTHGSGSGSPHDEPPPFIPTETSWFTSAAQHSPSFGGDSQTFQRILKWKFNDLKMVRQRPTRGFHSVPCANCYRLLRCSDPRQPGSAVQQPGAPGRVPQAPRYGRGPLSLHGARLLSGQRHRQHPRAGDLHALEGPRAGL